MVHRKILSFFLFSVAVTLPSLVFADVTTSDIAVSWTAATTDLNTIVSDNSVLTAPIYSSGSSHFVFTRKSWDKYEILVDGAAITEKYEEINTYFLGFIGNRVYFQAKLNGKWFIFVNGKKSELYDEMYCSMVWTSYDHISCSVRNGTQWYVIYDQKIAGPYESSDTYVTTANEGKLNLYKVTKWWKSYLVNNGAEAKLGFSFDYFYLSNDWKKIIFAATDEEGKQFVIYNGKAQKKYVSVSGLTFSPDMSQYYYIATNTEWKYIIIMNGKEIKTYDYVDYILFSTSGNHMYYTATVDGKQMVVLDSVDQKRYDSVISPMFSEDEGYFVYFAKKWDKLVLISNGKEIQK